MDISSHQSLRRNEWTFHQNAGAPQEEGSNRALTPLQWDYVLETAERMVQDEPERHERTLFIVATLFAMYLRVSDIVGRPNWPPVMGDFRQDPEGNWWYHVIGKGNKAGKVAVRDDASRSLRAVRATSTRPPPISLR